MVRIVHYINQFFAGIGGEEKGASPLDFCEGPKGPGIGIAQAAGETLEIVRTIWCGDNLINQSQDEILGEIEKLITEAKPDIVIAGPAFNAGRYGLACGMVAKLCSRLGIPVLSGLFPENPAVEIYRKYGYFWPTAETAAGMRKAIPAIAELAVKLGKNGKLGTALEDGYIPRGFRNNEYVTKNAARRAIDMLMSRLAGQTPITEVPLRSFEQVEPAAPLGDLSTATIAIVTGGGMVPKGNPDKLKQAFSDSFGIYSIEGMDELPVGDFKGIHGGFDSTWVDEDPDRVVPLDALRSLEGEGRFAKLYNKYFALCGIGTNVAASKKLGAEIAEEMKREGIAAAIFTST
ncbi:MAG: glycine/betaine/sarcosine/D-proline family reductase selenoprotein B [Spirochaetales bacterium]|jgi:glycine reductase complex component B subunit gamma|nr:glycine/betaine/sarcosine/D-proline family reductase selenoprotein B [Spirochaetales bacterium]